MPKITKTVKRFAWEYKKPEVVGMGWRATHDKRYDSPQWRRLTKEILAEQPFCQICAKSGIVTLATCTDHITAVRLGGEFWNKANLQAACKSCNNKKKT